jgi:hypothetical protein
VLPSIRAGTTVLPADQAGEGPVSLAAWRHCVQADRRGELHRARRQAVGGLVRQRRRDVQALGRLAGPGEGGGGVEVGDRDREGGGPADHPDVGLGADVAGAERRGAEERGRQRDPREAARAA